MDLLVPENGVFQPFLLREAQSCFDLRADVSVAFSFIQIGDENDRRNLFNQVRYMRSGWGAEFAGGLSGLGLDSNEASGGPGELDRNIAAKSLISFCASPKSRGNPSRIGPGSVVL